MSALDKKPLSKVNSHPPPAAVNRIKTSLLQTRRHSWFGASQEVPETAGFEKGIGIFSIPEENNEMQEEESTTTSWWSLQKWSKSESKNNVRQRKTSSSSGSKVGCIRYLHSFLQLY